MKKLFFLLCAVLVSLGIIARLPDFPDFSDDNGYLYKLFRDDVTGDLIEGHDGEVQFWGVDLNKEGMQERCEMMKKFVVPVKMTGKDRNGNTVTMRVTAVHDHAFSYFPNLEELAVPEGIIYVNPFSLSDCKAKRISIPASWTKHMYNFNGYKNQWESIKVAKAHPDYSDVNGVLFNKAKTVLVKCPRCFNGKLVLPPTLKVIGDNAFEDGQNLTKVVLPEGVDTLGSSAFYQSTIEELVLPASLKVMKHNALNYCKKLRILRSKSATPPQAIIREGTLDSMELWGMELDSLVVYIPKGSLEAYRNALWWRKIQNFVEE